MGGAVAGCDTSAESGSSGTGGYPPAGSYVHVQLRRDFLGVGGGTNAIGAMGEGAPQPVASSGELKRVTDAFLVLQVDNEADRELWIPREAVLLIDVRRKQQ
jgi:hypothetical protein